MLENIGFFYCGNSRQNNCLFNNTKVLEDKNCNLSTTYQQKMLKTSKTPLFLNVFLAFLCVLFLFSCSSSEKKAKKGHPAMENAVISMTEDEVKKKLGEPDIVSKTPENKIIWTYMPVWKIMPDNKDTVYIEFEDGKVVKVIKSK